MQRNIDIMEWPARSPDLNPLENFWAILAREFFKDALQFDTVSNLIEGIHIAWEKSKIASSTILWKACRSAA